MQPPPHAQIKISIQRNYVVLRVFSYTYAIFPKYICLPITSAVRVSLCVEGNSFSEMLTPNKNL